jgi:hypothetical protein
MGRAAALRNPTPSILQERLASFSPISHYSFLIFKEKIYKNHLSHSTEWGERFDSLSSYRHRNFLYCEDSINAAHDFNSKGGILVALNTSSEHL